MHSTLSHPTHRRAALAAAGASLAVGALAPWRAVQAADPAAQHATQAEARQARVGPAIEALASSLMAQAAVPGLVVGVSWRGQRWIQPFGRRAEGGDDAVTAQTLFEIGSISKMFTATLAAVAAAQGRLRLADHPGRWVPAVRGAAIDRATLLQLGCYTAGDLPLQFPATVRTDADALAWLRGWRPGVAPGQVRAYANPSIGLLGTATAAALGQGFEAALATHLLQPLGLDHTHLHVPPEAQADYAWGHRDGRRVRLGAGPLGLPAYGVKTTAGDLLQFLEAHWALPESATRLRQGLADTRRPRYRCAGFVQGLGWEQHAWPVSREALLGGNAAEVIFEPQPVQALPAHAAASPRLFSKTGSTNGFAAYALFVPSEQFAVVLLANSGAVGLPLRVELAHRLAVQLLPPQPA